MTFPGLRRAGNRAYRLLADVLELPGTEGLADIDVSQAFAVHDLTTIVQATLVDKYLFGKTVNPGAGGQYTLLDPFTGAGVGWDSVTVNGDDTGTAGIPNDHDCLVAHLAVDVADSGDFNNATFIVRYTFDGTNISFMPITSYLNNPLIGIAYPTTGDPYYLRSMPMFRRFGDDEQIYCRSNLTAGSDLTFQMVAYGAPRGVLEVPGIGG